MEDWKNINDINNYEISSFGRIRNINTKRVLKSQKSYANYETITILKKTYSIHRLVGLAFLQNLENKPTINHIDHNKMNNNVKNLEWATYSEQKIHSPTILPNNNKGIWQIDIITKVKIVKYNTIKEAALLVIGFIEAYKNISLCAIGKIKTAYGFFWEYDGFDIIENEEWKHIILNKQKNQNYYVSNFGRVRNKNRLLKQSVVNGYYNVLGYTVHILIANTFLNNDKNLNIVNHIDGNKLNNNKENLEWTTIKSNVIHGLQFRNNIKKVVNIDKDNNIIKIYDSCSHAGRELNVNIRSVNKCCKGLLKSCGIYNLKFKYLEEHVLDDKIKIEIKKRKSNIPKKIDVFNKNNILIETFNTITDVISKYKFNRKTIKSHCDKLVLHSSLNVYFRYHI